MGRMTMFTISLIFLCLITLYEKKLFQLDHNKHEKTYLLDQLYWLQLEKLPAYDDAKYDLSDYCFKNDLYKLDHPDLIYQDINIYLNPNEIQYHTEMVEEFYVQDSSLEDKSTLLKFTYNRIYDDPKFYIKYICLFQKTLRIPRFDNYVLGDASKMVERNIHFKNYNNFKKESYYLKDSKICQNFMISHPDRTIPFIQYEEFLDFEEPYSMFQYNCTLIEYPTMIYRVEQRPLREIDHKIQFSAFILLASTDNWISYLYRQVLVRHCVKDFDPYSFEPLIHNCNYFTRPDGSSQKGQIASYWVNGLSDYFVSQDFIENKLLPQLGKQSDIYLRRFINTAIDSRVAGLFEVQFTVNDSFEFFIDQIDPLNEDDYGQIQRNRVLESLHTNSVKLLIEHIKSKYHRIKRYINGDRNTNIHNIVKDYSLGYSRFANFQPIIYELQDNQ